MTTERSPGRALLLPLSLLVLPLLLASVSLGAGCGGLASSGTTPDAAADAPPATHDASVDVSSVDVAVLDGPVGSDGGGPWTLAPPTFDPPSALGFPSPGKGDVLILPPAGFPSGGTLFYTVDGSTPTHASSVYVGPIAVQLSSSNWSVTISAIATAPGAVDSPVAHATYEPEGCGPPLQPPTFDPPDGTSLAAATSVAIVPAAGFPAGGIIYYTTNGTIPNHNSPVYAGPIQLTGPTTIFAVATAPGTCDSPVVHASYTIAGFDAGAPDGG